MRESLKMKKILACIALFLCLSQPLFAQQPATAMPFQGFISNQAGAPINGSVSLTFKLYANANDQQALWTETLAAVPVNQGAFSVNLGEVSVGLSDLLTEGLVQYIGISINQNAELLPRQKLGSIPYAFFSHNSLKLGGKAYNEYLTQDALVDQIPQIVNQTVQQNIQNINQGLSQEQVNQLIDQRNFVTQNQVQTFVTEQIQVNQVNQVTEQSVNQIIDQRNFITQNQLVALLQNQGYITQAQLEAWILSQHFITQNEMIAWVESQNYQSFDEMTTWVNTQAYVNADQVRALITQAVGANGGLDTAAVNALIDLRGYLTQPAIQALIDTAIANLKTLLEQRIALVENSVAAVTNTVNTHSTEIQNLKNTTTAQANTINALNATVTALQNTVTAQQATITAQTASITDLTNKYNTQQTAITNLTNTVNTQQTAITNLTNNYNTQQTAITNLTTQVNNVATGSISEIIGVSATTSGRVSSNGKNGLQGANELCKAAFANVATSHVCSMAEVHEALATNKYPAGVVGTETWTVDPSLATSYNVGTTVNPETCQNFQYNSGDVATGITLTIHNYTSNGGGGSLTAHAPKVIKGKSCGTALPVLCCR